MRPLRLRDFFSTRFPVGAQQDVDEFMTEMMDYLSKAGLMREAFFDVVRSGSCACTRPSTPVSEASWKVSAFFPGDVTEDDVLDLKDMMNLGFASERVEGYECAGCKLRADLQRVGRIVQAPRIMMVHMLRFKNDRTKIGNAVRVPLTGFEYAGKEYRLHAVINHLGRSIKGGHFTATVFDVASRTWINYNDATTREVPVDDVITPDAYYLVFVAEDDAVKED